jgi:hypothetical protein
LPCQQEYDFNEIETATGNATIESMSEGLSTMLLLLLLWQQIVFKKKQPAPVFVSLLA